MNCTITMTGYMRLVDHLYSSGCDWAIFLVFVLNYYSQYRTKVFSRQKLWSQIFVSGQVLNDNALSIHVFPSHRTIYLENCNFYKPSILLLVHCNDHYPHETHLLENFTKLHDVHV